MMLRLSGSVLSACVLVCCLGLAACTASTKEKDNDAGGDLAEDQSTDAPPIDTPGDQPSDSPADTPADINSDAGDTIGPMPTGEPYRWGCQQVGLNALSRTDKYTAAFQAGCRSLQFKFPQHYFAQWGYGVDQNKVSEAKGLGFSAFSAYLLGMEEAQSTAPNGASASEREAYIPSNLYEPIWLSDGVVNPDNYWAYFMYNVFDQYGRDVQYYVIWDHPDSVADPNVANDWPARPPDANELQLLHGSIFDYVRMLRISREVADVIAPDVKIVAGGLRYERFLASIVRYTDNPAGGVPSPDYPETGAAYFDVVGFTHYGHNSPGSSDPAITGLLDRKERFQAELDRAGIVGKEFFLFETGASHQVAGTYNSGTPYARNFAMKSRLVAHTANIVGSDWWSLADTATADTNMDPLAWSGLYENGAGAMALEDVALTDVGVAMGTISTLLEGARIDTAATAAIDEMPDVRGVSYVLPGGRVAMAVWAQTSADEDATAQATLAVPADMLKHEWDWSRSDSTERLVAVGGTIDVALTGSPSILVQAP